MTMVDLQRPIVAAVGTCPTCYARGEQREGVQSCEHCETRFEVRRGDLAGIDFMKCFVTVAVEVVEVVEDVTDADDPTPAFIRDEQRERIRERLFGKADR